MFRGTKSDVNFFSRRDLTQIDFDALSTTRPATQAVIPASTCSTCGTVAF